MFKTEKLRRVNHELESSLNDYIQGLKMMITAEDKIHKHLLFLYEGNTSYEELINNLHNCIKKKNEIVQKEISSLQEAMKNKKKIEDQFKPIRPHTKEYFLKKKKMRHYAEKLPKLRDKMHAKEKLKG